MYFWFLSIDLQDTIARLIELILQRIFSEDLYVITSFHKWSFGSFPIDLQDTIVRLIELIFQRIFSEDHLWLFLSDLDLTQWLSKFFSSLSVREKTLRWSHLNYGKAHLLLNDLIFSLRSFYVQRLFVNKFWPMCRMASLANKIFRSNKNKLMLRLKKHR
jgi:hypothetical protein